jgi:hypothetical protein
MASNANNQQRQLSLHSFALQLYHNTDYCWRRKADV